MEHDLARAVTLILIQTSNSQVIFKRHTKDLLTLQYSHTQACGCGVFMSLFTLKQSPFRQCFEILTVLI